MASMLETPGCVVPMFAMAAVIVLIASMDVMAMITMATVIVIMFVMSMAAMTPVIMIMFVAIGPGVPGGPGDSALRLLTQRCPQCIDVF